MGSVQSSRWDGPIFLMIPGTACQATIAPSLRDNSQQALARCCCEMSASASRRDDTDRSLARSAWESLPRKNRPVGHGMIRYEGRRTTRTIEQGAEQIQARSAWNFAGLIEDHRLILVDQDSML